jgi:CRAL/TRIO domain
MMDYGENSKSGSVIHARRVSTSIISLSDSKCAGNVCSERCLIQVINILQKHYPERLGKALIQNAPYFFALFYKLIEPFIDSYTRDKIRFSPNVIEEGLFTPEMVLTDWGGSRELIWQHDVYWPILVKRAEDRKKVLIETWRGLGAKVGLKEWDMKSGSVS